MNKEVTYTDLNKFFTHISLSDPVEIVGVYLTTKEGESDFSDFIMQVTQFLESYHDASLCLEVLVPEQNLRMFKQSPV